MAAVESTRSEFILDSSLICEYISKIIGRFLLVYAMPKEKVDSESRVPTSDIDEEVAGGAPGEEGGGSEERDRKSSSKVKPKKQANDGEDGGEDTQSKIKNFFYKNSVPIGGFFITFTTMVGGYLSLMSELKRVGTPKAMTYGSSQRQLRGSGY